MERQIVSGKEKGGNGIEYRGDDNGGEVCFAKSASQRHSPRVTSFCAFQIAKPSVVANLGAVCSTTSLLGRPRTPCPLFLVLRASFLSEPFTFSFSIYAWKKCRLRNFKTDNYLYTSIVPIMIEGLLIRFFFFSRKKMF